MNKELIFVIILSIIAIIVGIWFLMDSLKSKSRQETFKPRGYYIIQSLGMIFIGLYILAYLMNKFYGCN